MNPEHITSKNRRWPQVNEWWATPFPSKRRILGVGTNHLTCIDPHGTYWDRTIEGLALNQNDHLISYISHTRTRK